MAATTVHRRVVSVPGPGAAASMPPPAGPSGHLGSAHQTVSFGFGIVFVPTWNIFPIQRADSTFEEVQDNEPRPTAHRGH